MQKQTSQKSSPRSPTGKNVSSISPPAAQRQAQKQDPRRRGQELPSQLQRVSARQQLQCPRCRVALQKRSIHGVSIDECPKCNGLWLKRAAFKKAFKDGDENWIGHLVLDVASMVAHPAPLQPKEGMTWYWY